MESNLPTLSTTELTHHPAPLTGLLKTFIADIDVRQSSKDTYTRALKMFFEWVASREFDITKIEHKDIIQFKVDLMASKLSVATSNSYISTVRRFYEWAEANKYYPNIAKGVKSSQRKLKFSKQALTPQQCTYLLNFCIENYNKRDYAIINLLCRTGLREIELIRSNTDDITTKFEERVLMIQGKGKDSKDDFVILSDKAFSPILEYIRVDRPTRQKGEPLFTSTSDNNNKGRLSTRYIRLIAKKALRKIGLNGKEYTTHSLRHSVAVNLLRTGSTIEDVQGILRHANIATTQIYTASAKDEMRIKNAPEKRLDDLF